MLSALDSCYVCSMCVRCCWSLLCFPCAPSVVHHCYVCSMCARCCRSLLCTFCVCRLDPWCMCSMHARCCWSLLCTFDMRLVLSILFTHFPCMLGAFDPLLKHLMFLIFFTCFLHVPSALDPLYKCPVLFFFFRSFHAWSFPKSWSFEPSFLHLIFSMPSPPSPLPVFGPWSTSSHVFPQSTSNHLSSSSVLANYYNFCFPWSFLVL